jgi:hypothetical protein
MRRTADPFPGGSIPSLGSSSHRAIHRSFDRSGLARPRCRSRRLVDPSPRSRPSHSGAPSRIPPARSSRAEFAPRVGGRESEVRSFGPSAAGATHSPEEGDDVLREGDPPGLRFQVRILDVGLVHSRASLELDRWAETDPTIRSLQVAVPPLRRSARGRFRKNASASSARTSSDAPLGRTTTSTCGKRVAAGGSLLL